MGMSVRLDDAIASFRNVLAKWDSFEDAMRRNARLVVRLSRDEFAEYARQTQLLNERHEHRRRNDR